jgi:elongator complex protein 3
MADSEFIQVTECSKVDPLQEYKKRKSKRTADYEPVFPDPQEVEDMEDFMKPKYNPMTDEDRGKYTLFVEDLVKFETDNKKAFNAEMKALRRKHRTNPSKSNLITIYRDLLSRGEIEDNPIFEKFIRKKSGKSHSGIVSITVVMGPSKFSCPMDCDYCPNDPTIARSYLLKEPSVIRGARNKWLAYEQFMDRAGTLDKNGHVVTKVELIILGGTFGSYPKDYSEEFIRDIYAAANDFGRGLRERSREFASLEEEIAENQDAPCAIIGLTLETRPDWINRREIHFFRRLGATRIQLGIQHLDDEILDGVNRRCPTWKTKKAIRLLKQNGFKVDGHFMPDLPGSSYEKDMEMFQYLFGSDNEDIQCDQLKVYPTMTVDYTKILEWYKDGSYKPYAEFGEDGEMEKLLRWICLNVPTWIRLNRIVRDIPTDYIQGGLTRVNMRQDIQDTLRAEGLKPRDIRGREVKGGKFDLNTATIYIDKYRSSQGDEYYISLENDTRDILYGFVRLRLSDDPQDVFFDCLINCALIRELHVYGELVHQHDNNDGSGHQTQHLGIGTLLMSIAEDIAFTQGGFRRIAVISGVGVRGYYAKLGYQLDETYMVKDIESVSDLVMPPEIFVEYGLVPHRDNLMYDISRHIRVVRRDRNRRYANGIFVFILLILAYYMWHSILTPFLNLKQIF